MAHLIRSTSACVLALATSLTCLTAAAQSTPATGGDANVSQVAARQQAQEIANGDPARWYRNDSEQQTLRKELRAALQEAQNACKQQPAADRKACVAEARATFQRDSGLLTKAPSN
ncbi:hypothetical protein ACFOY5_11785 [Massilia aurea]|uniref:hypothetical protein n=1 Tax=Massilia aurea TaxID=373040 RepID=UPI0021623808|nr:hypothetical protein [Massilia aurea]MCS0709263.1 hypothetical protein [Massilia aurea]